MASLFALWSELATAADQQRIDINGVPPQELQQQVVLQLLLSTSHLQTLALHPLILSTVSCSSSLPAPLPAAQAVAVPSVSVTCWMFTA
jgi:hypothetical protein